MTVGGRDVFKVSIGEAVEEWRALNVLDAEYTCDATVEVLDWKEEYKRRIDENAPDLVLIHCLSSNVAAMGKRKQIDVINLSDENPEWFTEALRTGSSKPVSTTSSKPPSSRTTGSSDKLSKNGKFQLGSPSRPRREPKPVSRGTGSSKSLGKKSRARPAKKRRKNDQEDSDDAKDSDEDEDESSSKSSSPSPKRRRLKKLPSRVVNSESEGDDPHVDQVKKRGKKRPARSKSSSPEAAKRPRKDPNNLQSDLVPGTDNPQPDSDPYRDDMGVPMDDINEVGEKVLGKGTEKDGKKGGRLDGRKEKAEEVNRQSNSSEESSDGISESDGESVAYDDARCKKGSGSLKLRPLKAVYNLTRVFSRYPSKVSFHRRLEIQTLTVLAAYSCITSNYDVSCSLWYSSTASECR